MAEEPVTQGGSGFLPPQPSGPEPDLGPAASPQAPEPPQAPVAPQAPGPPPGYQPYQGYPSPQQQLGWGAPPQGWQPPPPGWQPPPQQPWAYQPRPAVPDNGAAVAGFVLSLVSGGLLVLSAGLSSVVSVACAGLGILYSRRGKGRVDRGETPKHRGLAQAGFVIGIVSLVLSILATAAWIAIAASADLRDSLDGSGGGDPNGIETTVRLGGAVLRVAGGLVA